MVALPFHGNLDDINNGIGGAKVTFCTLVSLDKQSVKAEVYLTKAIRPQIHTLNTDFKSINSKRLSDIQSHLREQRNSTPQA